MAIVTSSPTRNVDALLIYVANDKADQRGERYVLASGLNGALPGAARHQYRDVRRHWGKDNKKFVEGYHVVQSFGRDELDPGDPKMWQRAHDLGRAVASERFPGRQTTVWTQRDGRTRCLHNHIVVNSIETATGRSMDSSLITHARLAEFHDRVLADHGFEQREDLQDALQDAQDRRAKGEPSGLRRRSSRKQTELKQAHQYVAWEAESEIADELGVTRSPEPFSVDVLRYRISELLDDPDVTDWDSLVRLGAERHRLRIATRGKKGVVTYGLMREQADGSLAEPGDTDTRRSTYLGADEYGRSAVLDRIAERQAQPAVPAIPTVPAAPVVAEPVAQAPAAAPQEPVAPPKTTPAEPAPAEPAEKNPFAGMTVEEMDAEIERQREEASAKVQARMAEREREAEEKNRAFEDSMRETREQIAEWDRRATEKEVSKAAAARLAEEQAAAVLAAEQAAAVLAEEQAAQAAESASTMSTPSAPAPAVAGQVYRSALRDVRPGNPRHAELFPLVAAFDERARAALLRGERIDESTVPKGIGPRFLDGYGDKLDPAVLEQLRMRLAKGQLVNKHYEAGKKAYDELLVLQESAEKHGDLTGLWQGKPRAKELLAERKRQNRVRDRLREEIAAGVYEELTPRASQETLDAVAQRSAQLEADEAAAARRRRSGPSLG